MTPERRDQASRALTHLRWMAYDPEVSKRWPALAAFFARLVPIVLDAEKQMQRVAFDGQAGHEAPAVFEKLTLDGIEDALREASAKVDTLIHTDRPYVVPTSLAEANQRALALKRELIAIKTEMEVREFESSEFKRLPSAVQEWHRRAVFARKLRMQELEMLHTWIIAQKVVARESEVQLRSAEQRLALEAQRKAIVQARVEIERQARAARKGKPTPSPLSTKLIAVESLDSLLEPSIGVAFREAVNKIRVEAQAQEHRLAERVLYVLDDHVRRGGELTAPLISLQLECTTGLPAAVKEERAQVRRASEATAAQTTGVPVLLSVSITAAVDGMLHKEDIPLDVAPPVITSELGVLRRAVWQGLQYVNTATVFHILRYRRKKASRDSTVAAGT